jgi:methylated-DNA-[protein]-cysteine S-methyltransferase
MLENPARRWHVQSFWCLCALRNFAGVKRKNRIADGVKIGEGEATLCLTVPTQFGPFTLREDDSAIVRAEGVCVDETLLLREAELQLQAYDTGKLEVIDLPFLVDGSDIKRTVCSQMSAILFGETLTHTNIVNAQKQSKQSVVSACGRNPVLVVIPCQRVMGAPRG